MSDVKLVASARTSFGKGAARQLRRDGHVPAVIYSRGSAAEHIYLDGHEVFLTVKNHRSSLLNIDLDGEAKTVIIKDVQRDPIGRVVEHIDFLAVKKGEKSTVEVPVVLVGEAAAGAQATLELMKATVEADVSALPENVEVSVDGLEAGTVLYVKDVTLPDGQVFINEDDQVVAVVNEIRTADESSDDEATDSE